MVIETCVGIATVAFVLLVAFLSVALYNLMQTLRQSKHTIRHVNALTLDLKQKVDSLNFLFQPLAKLNKKKIGPKNLKNFEKAAEVINFAADGVQLFKKLKRKKR
jgi:hypothetical protein